MCPAAVQWRRVAKDKVLQECLRSALSIIPPIQAYYSFGRRDRGGGFHFSMFGSGRRSTWIPCFMQESVTRRIPCVNIIPPDGFQLGGE